MTATRDRIIENRAESRSHKLLRQRKIINSKNNFTHTPVRYMAITNNLISYQTDTATITTTWCPESRRKRPKMHPNQCRLRGKCRQLPLVLSGCHQSLHPACQLLLIW
jgi:hypothetical protein